MYASRDLRFFQTDIFGESFQYVMKMREFLADGVYVKPPRVILICANPVFKSNRL